MTNSFRTIATAAATVAVTVALVGGIIAPAQAAPAGFPPIGPVNPGPSVPSIPPGTIIRPVVQFPGCPGAIAPADVARINEAARLNHTTAGFRYLGSYTTAIGTTVPALAAIVNANRHVTCVFGTDWSHPMYITFVEISSANATTINSYYDGNRDSFGQQVAPSGPGANLWINVTNRGTQEAGFASRDGWWVTAVDYGDAWWNRQIAVPSAMRQFLAINPARTY